MSQIIYLRRGLGMAKHETEMHRQHRELWQRLQATADYLSDALEYIPGNRAARYKAALVLASDCLRTDTQPIDTDPVV